jgi:Fic family protein
LIDIIVNKMYNHKYMSNVAQSFFKIQSLRERYHRSSIGKESLLKMIAETEVSEQVYNSNAIENSTLSLEETDKILLQIELERYISQREMFEAKNLARVVQYIQKKATESELNFDIILALHSMLMTNIRDEVAGRFRKSDEWVRVGSHIACNPLEIEERLHTVLWSYQTNTAESIITKIAKFHLGFEHIHPFVDGNGRIGRVLNNYLLMRDGYVPINIKFGDRSEYYKAFSEFQDKKSVKTMELIVARALTASYHKRLAYLENKSIITLKEYTKIAKISLSNALNKANRQTIEAFMEKNVWKIGV